MTSSDLAVTVLIPCFNAEESVSESVLSAMASCRESNRTFEILIMNDGSTDSSRSVLDALAAAHPEIVVEHIAENGGIVRALNSGLAKSRGSYIFRLDADDIMYPQRVEVQSDFLDSHPECGVVGSAVHLQVEDDTLIANYPNNDADLRFFLLTANCLAHPATTYRRELVQSVGGYSAHEFPCEDYGLWLRLLPVTEFHNLEQPLTKLRVTPGSISDRHAVRQAELSAELVEKYLVAQNPHVSNVKEVALRLCGRATSSPSSSANVASLVRSMLSLTVLHDGDKPGHYGRLASWFVVDSIRLAVTKQQFCRIPISMLKSARPSFVGHIVRASQNRRKLRMRIEQEVSKRSNRTLP
jgi:glycosyltransferase involved in cell wall biosynthesis